MVIRALLIAGGLTLLGGCVSTQFALVAPGPVAMNTLAVTANDGWNKAPGTMTGFLNEGSEMWTRDGLLLDRLMIFPGIGNGGTLFKSNSDALVFPAYKSGMLPNEISELTESSLAKLYGADTVVEASGLRPHRLGERRAVMFDLTVQAADQPTLSGRALAFVDNDKLYLMTFIAARLHYFDKHWDEAMAVMNSARIAPTG